ncbi:MAG: hypothetical protein HYY20_06480 [Candidatus Tectomicrobia bacterium]|uniref:Uncharacterized protein n=1 Tax=Tectimicrobiota bacterium TaxID=2528274 RepID=A0A932FVA5_UNCTE|nr:hypothetical protein [Candidatus Tectomicrobia bacterium]
MREEIRLGNEALGRGDLSEASIHFQELLTKGGTALEERIARNRLKEIEQLQKGSEKEKAKEKSASPRPARSKGTKAKKEKDDEEVDESTKMLFRLKDPILVRIKRY